MNEGRQAKQSVSLPTMQAILNIIQHWINNQNKDNGERQESDCRLKRVIADWSKSRVRTPRRNPLSKNYQSWDRVQRRLWRWHRALSSQGDRRCWPPQHHPETRRTFRSTWKWESSWNCWTESWEITARSCGRPDWETDVFLDALWRWPRRKGRALRNGCHRSWRHTEGGGGIRKQ